MRIPLSGLAIFGYDTRKQNLFLPVEYEVEEGAEVWLVDDNGKKQGEGIIEKVLKKPTKTNVARVKAGRNGKRCLIEYHRIHRKKKTTGGNRLQARAGV